LSATDQEGNGRTCAFCGARLGKGPGQVEDSEEHIIARKLLKYIPQAKGGRVVHQRSFPGEPDKTWINDDFDITAKRICIRCNSGWMDEMDDRAIPFIGPMMGGRRISLIKHGQEQVAAWASKVTLGLLLTMPRDAPEAPIEHYREIPVTKLPPVWTSVWLAAYEDLPRVGYQEPFVRIMPGVHAYGATILLGTMIVQVLGSVGEQPVTWETSTWDPATQRIWPYRSTVDWRPDYVIQERNLSAFCGRFLNA
jgi:hypothetical protein